MIDVSTTYAAALAEDARTFSARLLYNGSVISGAIRSLKISKGSCGEAQFDLGSVFCPFIECTIDETDIALQNKELLLQIGIMTSGDLDIPTFEYVDMGYFTVYNPTASLRRTTFTAYGRLSSRCSGAYISQLTYPAAIGDVLDEIQTKTGLTITRYGIDGTLQIETDPSGWKYVEVLNILAGLIGGYVSEDTSGGIVMATYTAEPTAYAADESYCTTVPTFADYPYVLDGITCVAALNPDEEGSTEYTYGTGAYTYNNEYMTQSLFNALVADVIGYQYDPGDIILAKGDPRLEPWDVVAYADEDGDIHRVPCMSVIITYDGGLTTQIIAPAMSREEQAAGFAGPMTARVEKLVSDAALALAIANQAQSTADSANTLVYDHNYTEEDSTYTFTAYLYKGSVDVSDQVDPDHFVWYLRTEDGDSYYASGRTMTVTEAELGYRASVLGGYLEVLEGDLILSDEDYEATSNGDTIAFYDDEEV